MEAARTSETSVDNHFTRQYNPEDNSEHHTRRRENLKSHFVVLGYIFCIFMSYSTSYYSNSWIYGMYVSLFILINM
jgi:hypothetical protein